MLVFACAVAALSLAASGDAFAQEEEIGAFPVAFTVAESDGVPVRDDAWIDAELARAEELFGPHGVHVKRASRRAMGDEHTRMVTRADRDGLAPLVQPGVINVFVVESLKDVDEADRMRFGVHWRLLSRPTTRYVILSSAAPVTVLAHELGHYFGNPHSAVPDNVMSYVRTGAEIFFDAAQIATIRRTARSIIATKEISLLPEP
jgi:hypothetical protein